MIPLRPISLGEILDGSISTIRRNPKATLGFSSGVLAVSTAITTVLSAHVLPGLQRISALSTADQPIHGADLQPFLGWLTAYGAASVVLWLAITVMLGGVLTAVAGRAVLGQQVSAGQAWQQARGRLGALLWLTVLLLLGALILPFGIIFGVAIVGGGLSILLVVPALIWMVFFWVRTSLAPPAVVLERTSAWRGITRSWRLTRGCGWRVFGIWLVSYLAALVAALVLEVPFRLIADLVSGISGFGVGTAGTLPTGHKLFLYLAITAMGTLVAATVTRPMLFGVGALLYVDLRMRREGLDIALQSAAGPLPGDEFATVWRPPPPTPW